MFKPIFFGAIFMLLSQYGLAQIPEILTLDQPETGLQDHPATLEVHFAAGYSYTPVGIDCMRGYITTLSNNFSNYAHLSKILGGGVYKVLDDKIYIQYREEYNSDKFRFNLYDDASLVVATENNLLASSIIGYGDNRIEIPVTGSGFTLPPGYYVLEVINEKQEKWYLRIEY